MCLNNSIQTIQFLNWAIRKGRPQVAMYMNNRYLNFFAEHSVCRSQDLLFRALFWGDTILYGSYFKWLRKSPLPPLLHRNSFAENNKEVFAHGKISRKVLFLQNITCLIAKYDKCDTCWRCDEYLCILPHCSGKVNRAWSVTLLLVIHMMTYECLYDGDDDNYIYEFCCGGDDDDLWVAWW